MRCVTSFRILIRHLLWPCYSLQGRINLFGENEAHRSAELVTQKPFAPSSSPSSDAVVLHGLTSLAGLKPGWALIQRLKCSNLGRHWGTKYFESIKHQLPQRASGGILRRGKFCAGRSLRAAFNQYPVLQCSSAL